MATKLSSVDILIVGMGWTGGILAKELAPTGLKIAVLERGGERSTQNDFSVPLIRDELRFSQRTDMMMDVSKDTYTIRNKPSETALPMRRLGSFLPGQGLGGAGVHWNGITWRWPDHEFRIRSKYEERYGKNYIPADMPLQDWGITGPEIEPYYDKFEYTAAVSGKAGNIKGQIQPGGNAFEDPRARDYPNPPLASSYAASLFGKAAAELGYHPYPRPVANSSRPYTNLDGMKIGQCQYCGFCERFGCEANAKGSPHITVIPVALRNPNVELRTYCWATKVLTDSTGRKATGVAYVNMLTGEEIEQPADLVILAAYGLSNVQLLLLSGIGKPYDPQTQTGVIGKNYAYQGGSNVALFFEGKNFNPFIAAGGWGTAIDDFHTNWDFDRSKHGYIGGSYIAVGGSNGRPIGYHPVPPGTPQWGSAWKRAVAKWYQSATAISASGSVMPNRYNYLDLDPTYRNRFGQPLMRMTFDFKDNEQKMNRHSATVIGEIGQAMNPTMMGRPNPRLTWNVVPYQSTHNTGGAIMGTDPATSALNKYLQSWDVPNVFVMGASGFPHNSGYNPTGPVGALAFRAADAIREKYLKHPGPLV
ncbi:MAG TPA: GMC family oxidoreductase [Xanthobacteraceae bacterium]|jgi:gluconate 2-dehydrogenase alpha chain